MTRENAVKIVEKKLNDENLGDFVKVSNGQKGTHGEAQCVYIERFPVKGNGEVIKKLKSMQGFRGNKSMNFKNQFEFSGWFEIG